MEPLIFKGRTIEVDEDGYLVNQDDWSPELAALIAQSEGIDELTDARWELIGFAREEFGRLPVSMTIKPLAAAIRKNLGDKKGSTKYLYEQFPAGPSKQINKIAGLPRPMG
jgi:tRNA 2-thiouridine synthesizing protein E